MNLIHYSKNPIRKIVQKRYYKLNDLSWDQLMSSEARHRVGVGKPFGLWVSCGSSWLDWCVQRSFRLESLRYKYRVSIKKDHKILIIDSEESFDEFSEKYSFDLYKLMSQKIGGDVSHLQMKINFRGSVHWNLVKNLHSGIIICPHFYKKASSIGDDAWYCGWDCASGCIWDVSCIENFQLICSKPVTEQAENEFIHTANDSQL